MYDYIPIILGIVFFLLGGFMTFFSKNATKKEFREDEEQVKKTRKNGVFIIICGIILLVMGYINIK